MKKSSICKHCEKEFTFYTPASFGKYCSNKCRQLFEQHQIVEAWKKGEFDGIVGYDGLSGTIRNYLLNKFNFKCSLCGWDKINPHTNKSPLHIHHKDGNARNNKEDNLEPLCPNCHSLTDNFGRRNKNSTRHKKKVIYK